MSRACCEIARGGGARFCGVCGRHTKTGKRKHFARQVDSLVLAAALAVVVGSVVPLSWAAEAASKGVTMAVISDEAENPEAWTEWPPPDAEPRRPAGGGPASVEAAPEAPEAAPGAASGAPGASSSDARVAELMATWRGENPATGNAGPGGATAPAPPGSARLAAFATASDYTRGSTRVSYGPSNAVDGNNETAWQVSNGGVGHWIRLDFGSPVYLDRLGIVPGYDKVRHDRVGDRWPLNNRLQEVIVYWEGGGMRTISLNDDRAMQWTGMSGVQTRWVRIEISTIYRGSRWNDTVVSEIAAEGRDVAAGRAPVFSI